MEKIIKTEIEKQMYLYIFLGLSKELYERELITLSEYEWLIDAIKHDNMTD
jgi:hypothetical protein